MAPAAMLLARIVAAAISFAVMAPATILSAVILRCVSDPPSMVLCESCGVPLASLMAKTRDCSLPTMISRSTDKVPVVMRLAESSRILASVMDASAICAVPTAPC